MFCHGEMVKGVVKQNGLRIKVYLCTKCGQAWQMDYNTGKKVIVWRRRRGVA